MLTIWYNECNDRNPPERNVKMGIMKKKLPIGIEDFEKLREDDFYYIDKTSMICELLDNWSEVNLFTRPRRFGKSLNMSMLKYFFEMGRKKEIFDGLRVSGETELCEKYQGKFPVISISLKGVSGYDFKGAFARMSSVIGMEAMRFQFLQESDRLTDDEKKIYRQLINVGERGEDLFVMAESTLEESLRTLCVLLEKHYGQKVILLIDEYDVPLAKAFEQGYYEPMALLIRNMFQQAFKTNNSLHMAVLTGCMRVSRESIFTGMNNLKILSIEDVRFHEYFGFTDCEVKELLAYYGFLDKYGIVKDWYDGYQFGNAEVYCPWDVINYCDLLRADNDALPQNYWANTSSNDAVRRFIHETEGSAMTKNEIEKLVAGETIEKEIHQELTYRDMYSSIDNIWSLLFATGYLTKRGIGEGRSLRLAIPNMEIREIFTTQIMDIFRENVQKNGRDMKAFCQALQNGNPQEVEQQFGNYLRKTISIRDTFVKRTLKENFYHGILLGILGFQGDWIVSSNRETGDGYGDILIEIEDEDLGIVIEVKYARDGDLETGCREALEQIEKKRYEEVLRDEGIEKILKYGIACYKKRCKVILKNVD